MNTQRVTPRATRPILLSVTTFAGSSTNGGDLGHYDTSAWATQKAIQKHFGLPESTLDMGKSNMREEGWGKVEDEYQRHKPLLHHFVQAVYDDTQKAAQEKGLTHILVHRGLGPPPA